MKERSLRGPLASPEDGLRKSPQEEAKDLRPGGTHMAPTVQTHQQEVKRKEPRARAHRGPWAALG